LTVGETVARARTAAGLTVAQVADSTRVRSTLIENIEKDDFRLCGGDVYAKGHLKTIATAVGLDPVALATAFDVQRGRVTAPVAASEPVDQPVAAPARATSTGLAGTLGAQMSTQRSGPNWTAVMALALAVVVGVGLISFLANRPSPSSTVAGSSSPSPSVTAPATAPTTPSSNPSSTPSTEPSVTTSPTDVLAQADGVVVKLTVTGARSWVRATNGPGGKTLYEGILNGGDTKTFRDKNLVSLVIGNAGAVSLVVNGKDLGNPGSGGQVIKVKFGPGDPTTTAG
jgi:cytoskeletal protein RodZ